MHLILFVIDFVVQPSLRCGNICWQ